MTAFHPMPNLIAQQEDNFEENASIAEMSEHRLSDELAVETKTSSHIHFVNWGIDNRSLHIAKLAPKGDKRGVIEATVEKEGHRFKLELCASGWRNSQDGYCAFYLTVANESDLFVARYRVQVGDITRISSIRHDFHLGVGFPNFCQQETLENLMENNSVRFLVTVEVFSCASKVQPPKRPISINYMQKSENVLQKLIGSMYNDRLHSDVSLVCQDLQIPAHKCILSHSSPVFRAMFAHNLIENTSNEVRMYDWDSETVLAMVEFLYTAKISEFITSKNKNTITNDYKRALEMSKSSMELDEDLCSLSFGINSSISPSPTPTITPLLNNLITNTNNNCGGLTDMNDILDSQIDSVTTINGTNQVSITNGLEDLNDLSDEFSEKKYNDTLMIEEETEEEEESIEMSNRIDLKGETIVNVSNNNTNNILNRNKTFKLFQLAEFYKIESLVIACCQKMHSELTVDNACHLLIRIQRYAHTKEIQSIKNSIWDFVTQHIEEIKQTNGYDSIVRYHPDLLRQLVDKMTHKFIKKEF